ncbi:MAG TPA: RluA family pseudouridine synthase [Thiothrix sp.]|nr:RluA family pseudouridine synthase [Thiothrix sp.]
MNNPNQPSSHTPLSISPSTRFQAVSFHTVGEAEAGQRIDNFLLKHLKPAPKSLIYRILRKGEVRVDKKRAKPDYRLQLGESVRIPPIRLEQNNNEKPASAQLLQQLEKAVMLEDNNIIVLNKPAGLAVHGGSGTPTGLIEGFRQLRPNLPYVELVHRLDKETSGLVLLAKNRQTLNALHAQFRREDSETLPMKKHYKALVLGTWQGGTKHIQLDLQREGNQRQKVQVKAGGKTAESIFIPHRLYPATADRPALSLLNVEILTGRMHQIRTQLAHLNHPIIGDDRYGDFKQNRALQTLGIKRLFLHAEKMAFRLDFSGQNYTLHAPLAKDLQGPLTRFNQQLKRL